MQLIAGPGATSSNTFTEGNPTGGIPATTVTSAWLNSIQAELAAICAAAGIALNPAANNQIITAILALITGGGAPVTAAGVSVADSADYFATKDVEAALAQLAAKIYDGTFFANQIDRSVVSLTATAVNIDATHAESIVQLTNAAAITYTIVPDSTLALPIGTMVTLFQGGAGQVTVAAGEGVTLKYPSTVFSPATLAQECSIVLVKVAADLWRVAGMLAAS